MIIKISNGVTVEVGLGGLAFGLALESCPEAEKAPEAAKA